VILFHIELRQNHGENKWNWWVIREDTVSDVDSVVQEGEESKLRVADICAYAVREQAMREAAAERFEREAMLDYQQRVVDEKKELDDKIQRLDEFLAGNTYKTLSEGERQRLARQLAAMSDYSQVLFERIAAFT
jgi:hypothetical protein